MVSAPDSCKMWSDPTAETLAPGKAYVLVEVLSESSHHARRIVRCTCCGFHWLQDYSDAIDWDNGDDPSWQTFAPAGDLEAARALHRAHPEGTLGAPCITDDWPSGAARKIIRRFPPIDASGGLR
jgi:hypothetical protein